MAEPDWALTVDDWNHHLFDLFEAVGLSGADGPTDGDVLEAIRSMRNEVNRLRKALRAAPMPERESIYKDEEYQERYTDWWHANASEDALLHPDAEVTEPRWDDLDTLGPLPSRTWPG